MVPIPELMLPNGIVAKTKEKIQGRKPYPLCEADPGDSEILRLVAAETLCRDKNTLTLPEIFQVGDLYLSMLSGGADVGDSLERNIKSIETDLAGGYLLPRYAEPIYGAVLMVENGRHKVDPDAAEKKREEIRKRRGQKARPVKEWLKDERQRVHEQKLPEIVKAMYESSMKTSPVWAAQFREFWELGEDFQFSKKD
jgi:acetone carboxylase, alpha subunit